MDPRTAPSDINQKPGLEKKDRTAISTLQLWVANKLLFYIASSKLSKEAWDMLKGLLEAQGLLGIVLAQLKLFWAKCKDGTSIKDHIRALRGYQEELHNLRQKIEDAEFSIILLTSLLDRMIGIIIFHLLTHLPSPMCPNWLPESMIEGPRFRTLMIPPL